MSINNMSAMLRISGISSGLDTDLMVSSLMKIEQLRIDRVMQQKIKMEWKRDARQEINKQITELRYSYASVLSSKNLNSLSAFSLNSVEMHTKTSAVSITVNSDALAGTHKIDSVTQLARAAFLESGARVSTSTLKGSTKLGDLSLNTALEFDENNQISFKIDEETFTFNREDTLDSMLRTVNNSKADVTMTYSAISGGFKLASNKIGADSTLSIENISGNAFANAGGEASAFGLNSAALQAGRNALLSVDGHALEQESNRFILDGIVFDLRDTVSASEPIIFTVSKDTDTVVDNIKAFLEDYNSLIDMLNGKLNEKIQSDYPPLTADQKEVMSEKEIEKWETLAQQGLFRNDREISSLLSDMRSAIYEKVEGVGKSLYDIGIKTGSYNDRGKLVIDEDKLRAALRDNPDDVAAVFAQSSDAKDGLTARRETGFMGKISKALNDYTSSFSLVDAELDIGKVAEKIAKMQRENYAKEAAYWHKFTLMETTLSTLNSQSNWLSQQSSMW